MKQQTYMQFDFKRNGSSSGPLLFSNPIETITTRNPKAVFHFLDQIDKAVEKGFYAAGYISYDALSVTNESAPPKEKAANTMPLLTFGVFHHPSSRESTMAHSDFSVGDWRILESQEVYQENFSNILAAIKRGEVEGINYTVPLEASFEGNAYTYYQQLKNAQNSDYSAYLSIDGFDILSASPELFFQKEKETVTVRPMKGTIHRGYTYEEDMQNREWLRTSEKNKLENKLTLDLMKQELARITIPGSIHTTRLYHVEKYPTVYQMTSELSGEVTPEKSVMDILAALFPCSSITGIPKTSAANLIDKIESRPREVYCGAIGYITPEKEAVFNVPIRTVWLDRDNSKAYYGAGGAITINSAVKEEYEEIQTKTDLLTLRQPTFELLETLGLDDGQYIVLNRHLERLHQSASYFDIPINIYDIKQQLENAAMKKPNGSWRVRLTVNQNGTSYITIAALKKVTTVQPVRLAPISIDSNDRFLYHKTTNRTIYDECKQDKEDVFDVLLWNEKGEVTEFTIGNLVAEINGDFYTPSISSGVLPGTFRSELLENGTIQERQILKRDLQVCTKLWLINSVHKWIEVSMI